MMDTNTEQRLAALERQVLRLAGQLAAHQIALLNACELLRENAPSSLQIALAKAIDPAMPAEKPKPDDLYGQALHAELRDLADGLRQRRV